MKNYLSTIVLAASMPVLLNGCGTTSEYKTLSNGLKFIEDEPKWASGKWDKHKDRIAKAAANYLVGQADNQADPNFHIRGRTDAATHAFIERQYFANESHIAAGYQKVQDENEIRSGIKSDSTPVKKIGSGSLVLDRGLNPGYKRKVGVGDFEIEPSTSSNNDYLIGLDAIWRVHW